MSADAQPWASSQRSRFTNSASTSGPNGASIDSPALSPGSVGDKLGGIFDRDRQRALPMYKDKPYAYPSSKRRSALLRQRWRILAALLLALLVFFYLVGVFSSQSAGLGSHHRTSGSKGRTQGGSRTNKGRSKANWEARKEAVRQAMKDSWTGYEKHAWGRDVYHPLGKNGKYMVDKGMGWIIVDALDTLMIMNLTTQLEHARQWVSKTLTYDIDNDVNTFETTIRMLGGLLSAHYLSTEHSDMAPVKDSLGDDMYLEKATDLAGRLMAAYNSTSGIPYASVQLHKKEGIASHDDMGASSTAEATTVQLEMKYLSKLTGETAYWETVEDVMRVVDDNGMKDGLLPIFIRPDTGTFDGHNIRLGSRGDSYYEYLIKQYLQTSLQEPVYLDMWEQALAGVQKHLITFSHPNQYTVLAERQSGLDQHLTPKMDHLVCFMPGTIALAATLGRPLEEASKLASWGAKQEREMHLARELTKTCVGMYKYTPTGLAPEIMYFHLPEPPYTMLSDFGPDHKLPSAPDDFPTMFEVDDIDDEGTIPKASWRADFDIHSQDGHNLQRPETVETLFYMWRITGDDIYREWGWDMFEAFMQHTRVPGDGGFSSVKDVRQVPPGWRDNMESFWLAETLKYFYLLFGPNDVLPLDKVVFNTEAHPFPRFELGKLFKTGWTRKPRDKNGNIVNGRPPAPVPVPAVAPPAATIVDDTVEGAAAPQEVKGEEAVAKGNKGKYVAAGLTKGKFVEAVEDVELVGAAPVKMAGVQDKFDVDP